MKYTIRVTQTDIKKGKRHSRTKCPIARAVKRATGRLCLVLPTNISFIWLDCWSLKVNLPLKARQFIRRFDNDKPVKPFQFTVNIPNENNTTT